MKKIQKSTLRGFTRWLDRYIWIIICCTAFVLGFKGYYQYYSSEASGNILIIITSSIYSTIRLFGMNVDISNPQSMPPILDIARWVALLATALTIIKTIELIFREKLGFMRLRLIGKHYVVFGVNKYSINLIEDLIRKRKKVVVIENDVNNNYLQYLKQERVLYVVGEISQSHILRKACISNSSQIIVFTMEDMKNIEITLNLKKLLDQYKPIQINVHIINSELKRIIEIENSEKYIPSSIDIKFFNIYENSAKVLFNEHPLYMNYLDAFNRHKRLPPVYLIIIGFGLAGENILIQAAKIGHVSCSENMKVVVYDLEAKKKEAWFSQRYPYIDNICDLTFVEANVFDSNFYSSMDVESAYITVCLDNDESNFLIASNIIKSFPTSKSYTIGLRISKETYFSNWINKAEGEFKNLFVFGSPRQCSSSEVIINENLDKLAKAVHRIYTKNKENDKQVEVWERLDAFIKDSNRAQADHIATKLYLAGLGTDNLTVSKVENRKYLSEQEFLEKIGNCIEELAKLEHKRWSAFYYINSWSKQSDIEKNNDAKLKKHTCLVEWDKLNAANQNYNIESIKRIYEELLEIGYGIYSLEVNKG